MDQTPRVASAGAHAGGLIPCRICGATPCEVIERRVEPYRVYRCPACDYAFVSPQPSAQALFDAYNQDEYYAGWVGAQAARRARMWRRRAQRVLGGLIPGRLLDVGCGEGAFLHAAQAMGWQVSGNEMSAVGCRMAQDQWKLEVVHGALEQASYPSGHFQLVALWHVIEHVPDPLATLQEVARVTRPGGRVVIACPNRDARLYRIAYWIGRGRPAHLFDPADREAHLSHFTARSLRRLIEDCGLQVRRVDVDRGHVQRIKYAVDVAATAWFRMTGVLWSEAMEVWAEKPSVQ